MLCHPYGDRVECHDGGKPHVIKPAVASGEDRITFLRLLHEELINYFETKKPTHASIEYSNLGQSKKNVIRHIGEVTGIIVSAALQAGASVEQA
jgi:hypothetical protein